MTQFSQEALIERALSECKDPLFIFDAHSKEFNSFLAETAHATSREIDFIEPLLERGFTLTDHFSKAATALFAEADTQAEALQATATLWYADEAERRQTLAGLLHQDWVARTKPDVLASLSSLYIETTDQEVRRQAIRDGYAIGLQSDLLPYIEDIKQRRESASSIGELGGMAVAFAAEVLTDELKAGWNRFFGRKKNG